MTNGDDDGDGGDGHDLRPEVEPAGEPAERPVRQALRPLVDRAGHREVARQLGEAQGDDELADDDDRATTRRSSGRPRPRPTPKLPNDPVETLMKLNAIAKFDRNPSDPVQLGLDAERPQVRVVLRRDVLGTAGPATISSSYLRTTGARLTSGE